MEKELIIFIVASIVLLYGVLSKLFEKYYISGPMIFLFFGILLSPLGFDMIEVSLNSDVVKSIAEIALVIVLFSDSSVLSLQKFKKEWQIPFRLLFIGLPLTILFSTYIATIFFPEESLLYLLLMTLVLAPTDAALGKAVVVDTLVAEKIRTGINIESGLNDGIVFPLLITVVLLITSHQELGSDNGWILYLVKQISFGFVIGAFIGYVGAKLLNKAQKKNWIKEIYRNLIPISLAIITYYVSEHLGGNGFISAFIAGIFFGNFSNILDKTSKTFLESEGEVFILISFLVFGLSFMPATIGYWNAKVLFYSLLSLTLLRMLPVMLSLIGLKMSLLSMIFIGWFGPRGIASILYVMTAAHSIESIDSHNELFAIVSLTIFLSIILHGLSAKPFVNLYSKFNN